MIAACNGWVVSLDNVSHLPHWLSDAICRLATGGGFSTRELYTNGEEVLFDAQRPIILNGIEEVITRGDLMERSLILNLPQISEEARMDERRFWSEFEVAKPRILGVLLDAVSFALKNLPTVELAKKPRMADFALWATSAEPALGCSPGTFLNAYTGNREAANDMVLESSAVASEVRSIERFEGTAAELLCLLDERVSESIQRQRTWPKSPRGLAGTLRRLAPHLRAVGILLEFDREPSKKRRRVITIRKISDATDRIVRTVQSGKECRENAGVAGAAAGLFADGRMHVPGRSPDDLSSAVSLCDDSHAGAPDGTDARFPGISGHDKDADPVGRDAFLARARARKWGGGMKLD